MRRSPTRKGNTRLGASLSSPNEGRSWMNSKEGTTNGRSGRRAQKNEYTDLDRAPMPIENYLTQKRQASQGPKPRTRRQPEGFLTKDNSSFAFKALPAATPPRTAAAEESILKKWEAWSTQMGTQLALESAVPATPVARAVSRNSSFRSMSQLSNNSFTRPQPGSARGASPLSQSGRRSVSRGSSRSRQSSLASTVVEPFRVGDRMTASAERRRRRPQSTKGSRELLFRRALGLEDDRDDPHNLPIVSASQRTAPVPGPLVAVPKTAPAVKQPAETRQAPSVGVEKRKLATMETKQEKKDDLCELQPTAPKATAEEVPENYASHKGPNAGKSSGISGRLPGNSEAQDDEWVKKSVALLSSKDQPYTEVFEEEAARTNQGSRKSSPVPEAVQPEAVKAKWHLPLGEAAQMICGRVAVHTIENCRTPQIGYRDEGGHHAIDGIGSAPPLSEAFVNWAEWPLDRASVSVLFVDHHVDDDQLSVYGVEVPPREDCSPEVLPDWNESRRRFAPAPLEDSQPPQ